MSNRSIAEVNDAFRRGDQQIPGRVVMTSGISALGDADVQAILAKVQDFDDFTEANDPYKEHDFGNFMYNGEKFFWKIDYYDPSLQYFSEDKSDLSKTVRVLTIMFASEY